MIVLAVILLLLAALALIPVGVRVQYDAGDAQIQAAIGPARITLYPRGHVNERKRVRKQDKLRRKRAKRRAKAAARPPKQEALKQNKKLSPAELRPFLDPALDFLQGMRKKLLVRELTLVVTYGGEDAAKTAIGYGRAWAVIGAVIPVLENSFRIKSRRIEARLDYEQEKLSLYLLLDVRMRIGTGLLLGLKAGFQFLKTMLKTKKGGAINESSTL